MHLTISRCCPCASGAESSGVVLHREALVGVGLGRLTAGDRLKLFDFFGLLWLLYSIFEASCLVILVASSLARKRIANHPLF
jgi:hypothetical protein